MVRLELLGEGMVFRPPLDDSTNDMSVQELVQSWIGSYMNRAKLVEMLGKKVRCFSYQRRTMFWIKNDAFF